MKKKRGKRRKIRKDKTKTKMRKERKNMCVCGAKIGKVPLFSKCFHMIE